MCIHTHINTYIYILYVNLDIDRWVHAVIWLILSLWFMLIVQMYFLNVSWRLLSFCHVIVLFRIEIIAMIVYFIFLMLFCVPFLLICLISAWIAVQCMDCHYHGDRYRHDIGHRIFRVLILILIIISIFIFKSPPISSPLFIYWQIYASLHFILLYFSLVYLV